MSLHRFSWKVSLAAAALVAVTALLIGFQLIPAAAERRLATIEERCLDEAALVAAAVQGEMARHALVVGPASTGGLPAPPPERLQALAERLSVSVEGRRITLIAPDGRVLADSHERADVMENHGSRPEVLAPGRVVPRLSRTLGVEMLYAASIVTTPEDAGDLGMPLLGYARVAVPLDDVATEVARLRGALLRGTLIALAGGLLLAVFAARQLTRPLRRITDSLQALGRGDYSRRLPETDVDEVGQLVRVVNIMADQLAERVERLREALEQDQAILGAMEEGVLAVDAEARVVAVNDAARSLLDITVSDARGRPLTELTRVPDVIQAVTACLEAVRKVSVEVRVQHGPTILDLSVSIVPLAEVDAEDGGSAARGAVAVLHDLTELRRLETVRRDFVANVSHELKTPLTAVKGFIEAVREDADMTPEVRENFLARAAGHTDRLADIVADLLTLARLESGDEPGAVTTDLDLAEVVRLAVAPYRITATQRGVALDVEIAEDPLPYHGDAAALETAVSNLVSNALKYSPVGGTVRVRLRRDDSAVWAEVEDEGPGIPTHEQERIFERFYRVDKDRSRAVGGTGLGLSIVKHAVSAHGGQVRVVSQVGVGSRFVIRLPLRLDRRPDRRPDRS